MTSKATESELATLHRRVAETMTTALNQSDVASNLLLRHAEVNLPEDIRRFLEECVEVAPSLLTAATKFLKDNNITADGDSDDDLALLGEKLNKRRSKGTLKGLAIAEEE